MHALKECADSEYIIIHTYIVIYLYVPIRIYRYT